MWVSQRRRGVHLGPLLGGTSRSAGSAESGTYRGRKKKVETVTFADPSQVKKGGRMSGGNRRVQ